MARAIDAEKLLEQLQKKTAGPANKRYTEGFNDCLMRVRSMVHSAPTLQDENEKLRAELEQVKRERYVAIEYLREIEWCAGCKHFGGLDGCKKWAMGQCTEKHDMYEFFGPQKED